MPNRFLLTAAVAALVSAPAAAQLSLPSPDIAAAARSVVDRVGSAVDTLDGTVPRIANNAQQLAGNRLQRLAALVRRNRETIERDASGDPARKGELLVMDATADDLARVTTAGFRVMGTEHLGELGLTVTRLGTPDGQSLARAEVTLRKLLPQVQVSADTLFYQSGVSIAGSPRPTTAAGAGSPGAISQPVGVIDGGPGSGIAVAATRGFARGAPAPSHHASAVVSLLQTAGVQRIVVADVYGADPAGGNALAIAQAFDWMVRQGVRVVSISLVGPSNPVLARTIEAARKRGVYILAAVGNDGPAAPPAFPASYPGVLAITGVDGRNRALIEAGRASHLDYAAPGSNVLARDARGRWLRVRGTSYAVPLAAARAAAALAQGPVAPALDREAIDLGARGPDPVFGRGLLCRGCGLRN